MNAARPDLHPNQQGILYVEFLVLMPMFISLWLLTIYAFDYHSLDNLTQRMAREEAWTYAMGGCRGAAPDRPPGRVDDGELRRSARGGFERLAGLRAAGISNALRVLIGQVVDTREELDVHRPVQFGGKVSVVGDDTMMCATPSKQVPKDPTVRNVCRELGGQGCS